MAATADDMAIGGNMAKTISFSTTPKAAEATTAKDGGEDVAEIEAAKAAAEATGAEVGV